MVVYSERGCEKDVTTCASLRLCSTTGKSQCQDRESRLINVETDERLVNRYG